MSEQLPGPPQGGPDEEKIAKTRRMIRWLLVIGLVAVAAIVIGLGICLAVFSSSA